MGRYHILLNKFPEPIPEENTKVHQFGFEQEENTKVHQFGFEQDFQSKYKVSQKKQRIFHLNENERARIGFVYEEGQKDIFSGSAVHFYGRRRFFCKSTANRTALCCSSAYSGSRSTLRIAVPIIQYDIHEAVNYEIMPWVFGKIIFNRIKEIHSMWAINLYDIFVITRSNINPFNQYDIEQAGHSLWREHSDKELILQAANSLRQNMMPYLAEDLDENTIETLLGQPPTTYQRPLPQRQRRIGEGDFWAAEQVNIAPEPEPEPRPRRDLHRVLDNL